MPTRKGAAKGAARGTKKGAGRKAGAAKKGGGGDRGLLDILGKIIPGLRPHPLYGRPVDEALASGKLSEIRRLLPKAQKYQRELEASLAKLEQRIRRG